MTHKDPKPKRVKLSSSEKDTRNQLLKQLKESGDYERIKLVMYAQLMMQRSWREELNDKTRKAVQQSGGASEITLDELALAMRKAKVPQHLQANFKAEIRRSINSNK